MAGWQANIFLFGIFTHAFLCYTQTKLYKRDSWRTKALFWVVFFFGALEAGLNFEEVYHFGGMHFCCSFLSTADEKLTTNLDSKPAERYYHARQRTVSRKLSASADRSCWVACTILLSSQVCRSEFSLYCCSFFYSAHFLLFCC